MNQRRRYWYAYIESLERRVRDEITLAGAKLMRVEIYQDDHLLAQARHHARRALRLKRLIQAAHRRLYGLEEVVEDGQAKWGS